MNILKMFDDAFMILDKLQKNDDSMERICVMSEYFAICDRIMVICGDVNLYNMYMGLHKSIRTEQFEQAITLRDNIRRHMKIIA